MTDLHSDEQQLRHELDAARVSYGVRFTASGAAYASFGLSGETAANDALLTAIIRDGSLQLTAHAVLKTPKYEGDVGLFNDVNREWALGCAYYDDADRSWNARVAMPLLAANADGTALLAYLSHLHAAQPALRSYDLPRNALPSAAPAKTVADVVPLLAAHDIEPQLVQAGEMLEASTTRSGEPFRLQTFVMPGSVLVLRGRHPDVRVAETAEIMDALTAANSRLTAAKLLVWPGQGQIYTELAVPLAAIPLTSELIGWGLDQVAQALQVASLVETSR